MDIEQVVLKIKQELEVLKPYVSSHNGQIKFVKFEKHTVFVSLKGACETCPLSFYTVTMGLEQKLKKTIPEVHYVEVLE